MSLRHRRPRAISLLLAGAAGLALVGLTASPASAASVSNYYGSIYYSAQSGEANDLQVSVDGSDIVFSDVVPVTTYAPCTQSGANAVRCPLAGVYGVTIGLNDGNDQATVDLSSLPGVTVSVYGGEGDDTLTGGAGNEQVYGHAGNDTLAGGAGDDYLDPGEGNDSVSGGPGLDTVGYNRTTAIQVSLDGNWNDGAPPTDIDNVNPNVENVSTGSGDDTITGSGSNNSLSGGAGNDTISGLAGKDTLNAGAGTDTLNGGDGDDTVNDGDGADTLLGGAGDDDLEGSDYRSADVFSGGPGVDLLPVYRAADVSVSLNNVADDGAPGEGDNVKADVEDITTGSGDDVIVGSAAANEFSTGAGHDRIVGGDGSDWLNGGRGRDNLNGSPGIDSIYGEGGADTITSQDKHPDQVDCGSSVDSLNRDGLDDVSVTCEKLT